MAPDTLFKSARYFSSQLLLVVEETFDGSVLMSFNEVSTVSNGPRYSYAI